MRVGRATRANSNRLLGFLSERDKKLVRRDSGLFENAAERADFDFAVVRNDTPGGTSTQNDVTAALAYDHKAKPFKRADGFRT